ncbi:MAG: hypothetical protein M3411_06640 [Chloroflexota bacterium]|jgi:hypothetical protein|nr:hypothetical protein [Chloroflexia bacterium]MDQ3467898.1 hypothetical protein [Chloroflexota bacterium]
MWHLLGRLRELLWHREVPTDDSSPLADRGESAEAIYYEVATKKLDFQFHNIQLIDARASTLFTIGSTILPITAGLLTSDQNALDDCAVAKVSLFLGFVFYMLLAIWFLWSYRISKWDSRPDPLQWKEVTVGRTEAEMQRWLGDACVEAYASNEPAIDRKASKIGAALWFLAAEAACLTIAVLAPLWPVW